MVATVFWNEEGVIFVAFMGGRSTITADIYSETPKQKEDLIFSLETV